MSEQAVNAALGAMASTASALSNLAAPAIEGKTSYKYTKKLLADQFKYSQKAFDMENQRQDYLLNNSVKIQRDALRNAGYSTADPNGTGVTAASPSNVSTPSPATISTPMSGFDLGRDMLVGAQLKNIMADTMKKTSESEQIRLDMQLFKDTYQTQVDTIKSKYYNLTKENKLLDTKIDNLAASTANIDVDTRFKQETFDKRKEQLFNEVELLIKDNKIKEVSAKLADYGIVLGASDIGTILSVAASDKGEEATKMFAEFIANVVGALPSALGQVIKALWNAATPEFLHSN